MGASDTVNMAAASTSTSDDQTSRPSHDTDTPLDTSVLKEIARKGLVDALNSVCHDCCSAALGLLIAACCVGERREDIGLGPIVSRAFGLGDRSCVAEGACMLFNQMRRGSQVGT